MPDSSRADERLLERVIRHALREQHLDQRQRAYVGGGRERKRQEPELRGERAHEAREHRRLPQAEDRLEHIGRPRQQIDRQHQRLHEQAEHQRVGRRRHEGDAGHGDDRAAKADRRQREGGGRDQANDGRLQFRKTLFAARPQRGDDDADGGDQDRNHLQQGEMIAEEDEAEDRGLDRLGLQIGRRHHEASDRSSRAASARWRRSGSARRAAATARTPRSAMARGRRSRSARPRRNTSENGKPNRKRILVAPQVPSGRVSDRCIALRATCPSAAMMVKGIQSVAMVSMCGKITGRAESRQPPCRAQRLRSTVRIACDTDCDVVPAQGRPHDFATPLPPPPCSSRPCRTRWSICRRAGCRPRRPAR